MKVAVKKMTRYMTTYEGQTGYKKYTDTYVNDIVYGLGISLSDENEYSKGYNRFKDELLAWLTADKERREASRKAVANFIKPGTGRDKVEWIERDCWHMPVLPDTYVEICGRDKDDTKRGFAQEFSWGYDSDGESNIRFYRVVQEKEIEEQRRFELAQLEELKEKYEGTARIASPHYRDGKTF